MFCKSVIKTPYMFQSLFYDCLQGSSFVLGAFTTFQLPASSFVFLVCGLMSSIFTCVRCTYLWVVWSCGRDQTTHRQVHRTHIQIDGIRPHTKKINDEAGS
jgi:hypothetical protein